MSIKDNELKNFDNKVLKENFYEFDCCLFGRDLMSALKNFCQIYSYRIPDDIDLNKLKLLYSQTAIEDSIRKIKSDKSLLAFILQIKQLHYANNMVFKKENFVKFCSNLLKKHKYKFSILSLEREIGRLSSANQFNSILQKPRDNKRFALSEKAPLPNYKKNRKRRRQAKSKIAA